MSKALAVKSQVSINSQKNSTELKKAIDEQFDHTGAWVPWKLPKTITTEMKEEARRIIAFIDENSHEPSQDEVMSWLADAALLIESKKDIQEIKVRLGAYVRLLNFPAYCYLPADQRLREFGEKHKFLPAYADLADFFKEILENSKKAYDRCHQILKGPPKAALKDLPPEPPTEEQKKRVQEILRKAGIGLKDTPQDALSDQGDGLDDGQATTLPEDDKETI